MFRSPSLRTALILALPFAAFEVQPIPEDAQPMSTDAQPILEYTQPIRDAAFTLGTENARNRWSATIPPVLTVPSGAVVELHTKEASDGQITESTGVDDLADIAFGLIHALTGPIYVEGATPGDVLAVTIHEVYLPVQVDGALFSISDTHAAQGDGEVSGTAIEAPMRIVLTLEVVENTRGMVEPQYETGDCYAVTGFATTIDRGDAVHDRLSGGGAWAYAGGGLCAVLAGGGLVSGELRTGDAESLVSSVSCDGS